jgi:glutathione S-transferase
LNRSPITLYVDGYFVNQFDASVMTALVEKGLEYSIARALLRDGGGVPAQLARTAMIGRVPALQHGDFWLTESSAIIEYLEETFAAPDYPPLLPADPRQRARARQIMSFVRTDVFDLRTERSYWMCVYPAGPQPPLSRQAERDARELIGLTERFAAEQLPWCMAHADLAYTLLRLARTEYPLTPAATAFLDEHIVRPSIRAYLEHTRPPNPPPRQLAAG